MPTGYYVTVVVSDVTPKVKYARGPFPTHEQALQAVEPTRKLASSLGPRSVFYGWGITRLDTRALPLGPMNSLFTDD